MKTKVNSVDKTADTERSETCEQVTELSEDMVMVSPGAMLREARNTFLLSQEHIASKLNFKVALVQDIEEDKFDPSLSVTFNRGYIASYAKLVSVDVEDVLASYDALDAANIQRSEMLSFSKETLKQAEHSRVMWLSYLIVAVLFGLTILWWQQESSQQAANTESVFSSSSAVTDENSNEEKIKAIPLVALGEEQALVSQDANLSVIVPVDIKVNKEPKSALEISTAVFTFSGDCWVNIFDATGERIAWGVKKSGYVMTIQGIAPLHITVGKPELSSIVFNGQSVDMSPYNVGNIAKFTLPLVVE